MPTIADVAGQLAGADVPVFLPDTCILLDIIRCIKRGISSYAEVAAELLQGLTGTPLKFASAASHLVMQEWTINAPGVLAEAEKHLRELEVHAKHFHTVCKELSIKPGFRQAIYSGPAVADKLKDLSSALLSCALEIDDDNNCKLLAMDRSNSNTPPSQKGSQSKDCTIIEQYLALSRDLKSKGFSKKIVFCTSNTKDYCQGGNPAPNLQADFVAVGMTFTSNLGWALHELSHT